MNIVIAVHHFPPHFIAGAEWRAFRTASALQDRGHQVQVVCVERPDYFPKGWANNNQVPLTWKNDYYEGVHVRRLFFNLALAPDQIRWEYDNRWVAAHLNDFLLEIQPDIFHLIGGYLLSASALGVSRKLNLPTIVSLTDFWFLCRRITMFRSDGKLSKLPINPVTCARCLGEEKRRYRWAGKYIPWLMDVYWRFQTDRIRQVEQRLNFLRETLNQVDLIISPSRFLQESYVQAGVDPGRIIYARQGRDFPQLVPELLEKTNSPVLRIGYIGQITKIKGLHVLLMAASQLKDEPLVIKAYGDPTPFPHYTQKLKGLIGGDQRIQLMGSYKSEQLSQVLRGLDVIVVPSLWYENSPNVILEAHAHLTPVIASNLGGMAELIEEEKNGLLYESGNPDDLARQIKRLIHEPGLLLRLKQGIGPVKSLADEIDELETFYTQINAQVKEHLPL